MRGIHTICPELVGTKRPLIISKNMLEYEDLQKKIKADFVAKIEELQPAKTLLQPQPLVVPTALNGTSANMSPLQSLILLSQANLVQKYFSLLTMKHYMQQTAFLSAKKDNSASSYTSSGSTDSSFSSIKTVPIILKKPEPSLLMESVNNKVVENQSINKKNKVSACKNYIALLCTGFARCVLTADSSSDVINFLKDLMTQKRDKYPSVTDKTEKDLLDFILDHISKDICGKKVKKTNKGRDFKVRNTEELEWLLNPKEDDIDLIKFRKEVLKGLIDYFFVSKYYMEWLNKGMINEANKNFFLKNKVEIRKKFENPTLYKPHFDYNSH